MFQSLKNSFLDKVVPLLATAFFLLRPEATFFLCRLTFNFLVGEAIKLNLSALKRLSQQL